MSQFALNEDQIAIWDMALSFAQERIAPHALDWDQQKNFPVDVLREAAALGMAGIYTRDEFGGSELTRLDAALIFEALATGCPAISAYLSIHNMVTWMIDRFGSEELRARYVPALCSMEMLASYCLTEPGAGSDAAALSTSAMRDGDHYVLNGVKQFISGAGTSDVYLSWRGPEVPDRLASRPLSSRRTCRGFHSVCRKRRWAGTPSRPPR